MKSQLYREFEGNDVHGREQLRVQHAEILGRNRPGCQE